MADKPAATLLHLGCGLGNGLANLHNARKGKVPVVNIVGDHATHHTQYDAQLQSDIETVARNVSPGFVRTSQSTAALCQDAADAITAARGLPGQVATLILPADVSWGEGGVPCPPPPPPSPEAADDATVQAIAQTMAQAMTQAGRAGGKAALLLGGQALREPGSVSDFPRSERAPWPLPLWLYPAQNLGEPQACELGEDTDGYLLTAPEQQQLVRKQAKRVEESTSKGGLLIFRLENLFRTEEP